MFILISPAKTLDFESPVRTRTATQPGFLDQSETLVNGLRKMSSRKIGDLMGISKNLSELNRGRFQSWSRPFDKNNAKQALFAFRGDVYTGLDADTLSAADCKFAQKHLRILSGLYGVLKPLDLIQPYRLEMGTQLKTGRHHNLYEFWGSSITDSLNQELEESRTKLIVNLASNEYFKAVRPKILNADLVTPIFKDAKNGRYKVISFFAKKARGMMVRYIVQNRIKTREKLKRFDAAGYTYSDKFSSENQMVFTRESE